MADGRDAAADAVREDVSELLNGNGRGTFVRVDVVMVGFGLSRSQAFQLAKDEGWRWVTGRRTSRRGFAPREFVFEDVQATYRLRHAETKTTTGRNPRRRTP